MIKINQYIQEKLIINKNSTAAKHIDSVDHMTCCDELYQLMDDIYNDKDFWNSRTYSNWEDERKEFFEEIIHGDRRGKVSNLLDELVDRERISEKDGNKYWNDIIITNFCKEIATRLLNNEYIDFNRIYQEIAM